MARRTTDEMIQDKVNKLNQMNAQLKNLERRKKEEDRKKRTRRLIQIGGVAEAVLGRTFDDDDVERFQHFLNMQQRNGMYYSKAMNNGRE